MNPPRLTRQQAGSLEGLMQHTPPRLERQRAENPPRLFRQYTIPPLIEMSPYSPMSPMENYAHFLGRDRSAIRRLSFNEDEDEGRRVRQRQRFGKKWIQSAIKNKGSFRRYISKKYSSKGFDTKGRIKLSVLKKESRNKNKNLKIRRKAILAMTLRSFKKKSGKRSKKSVGKRSKKLLK